MPRTQGSLVENKFIRGLITENTALSFPTDAATETWNCIFDETGRVTRRKGIDLESSYTAVTATHNSGDVFAEFIWDQVGSDSDTSFLVQQIGPTIHFFDITSSTIVSDNKKSFTIDLTTYTDGSVATNVRVWPADFTQGSGKLYIASRYHPPLSVEYDALADDITINEISLTIRDTVGIENDGWTLLERKVANASVLVNNWPEHAYNLINQGWYIGNALEQWDTARADMPSNADQVGFYRVDNTDPFGPTLVTGQSTGNTPAPRGHIFLEVGRDDRMQGIQLLVNELPANFSLPPVTINITSTNAFVSLIPQATGTVIGDFDITPSQAFDGNIGLNFAEKTASANAYIGKNWGTGKVVSQVVAVTRPEDAADFITFWSTATSATDGTIFLYGSNTLPSNGTDGTLLGTSEVTAYAVGSLGGGFTSAEGFYQIRNDDWTTAYQYHWVYFVPVSGSHVTTVAELYFYEPTVERQHPARIAFFNGRLFYGGFTAAKLQNKVFFSQVIERTEQEGMCYQSNDPTSEFVADLVASDGGVIELREMNELFGIIPYQDQLLLLAKNGTFSIKGTASAFAADDFSIRKISGVGMYSPQSIVDVKGTPIWWAEDGIYTVQFDANFSATTIQSLSENTIKQFIINISPRNRKHVKGTYDRLEDIVYWVCNDSADYTSTDFWTYNKVLCLNSKSVAFYPWNINTTTQKVNGVVYIQDGSREATTFSIKFPTTLSSNTITYSQEYQSTYLDWTDFATLTGVPADETDYVSYFVSGYRVEGEGMRDFQANYIFPFLVREADASIWIQGIYAFTDNSSSGKWSTPQQGYRSTTVRGQEHKEIKRSRLKIRGHGEALQIKMFSETGKPFTMIGWGVYATGNQVV